MIGLSVLHLIPSIYSIFIAVYPFPKVQLAAYYLSNSIMTLSLILIGMESSVALIGFIQIKYNDSAFLLKYANSLFSNVFVILAPFLLQAFFIYYEAFKVKADYAPEDTRLFHGGLLYSGRQEVCREGKYKNSYDQGKIIL
jgi:hypothetical protein